MYTTLELQRLWVRNPPELYAFFFFTELGESTKYTYTVLQSCKGRGFESHLSKMPVISFKIMIIIQIYTALYYVSKRIDLWKVPSVVLQSCKGLGFESHQSNMPAIVFTDLMKVSTTCIMCSRVSKVLGLNPTRVICLLLFSQISGKYRLHVYSALELQRSWVRIQPVQCLLTSVQG